jgi:DNA-binding IclR family transcriptional regulator
MSASEPVDGARPAGLLLTLVKGLSILTALAEAPSPRGLSHAALARQLKFQRSTLYRYLSCLQELGFVEEADESHRYRLGPRLVVLGAVAFGERGFTRQAKRFVNELAAATGETAHATILDDDHAVTVEIADGAGPIGPRISIGSRRPVHCSASGKIFLGYGSSESREEYLTRELEQPTPLSIVDAQALRAQLATMKRRGYATDEGEYVLGIACVAAPVFDFRGEVAGTLSISIAAPRLDKSRLDGILFPLVKISRSFSHELGYLSRDSGREETA